MEKVLAFLVKDVGRVPVDGPIQVVLREKAKHPVQPGWSYRFQSGKEWVLLPVDHVTAVIFAQRPDGDVAS